MKKARQKHPPVSAAPPRQGVSTRLQMCVLLGASLVFLILGWRLFWFLADDAFISFRYVSNSMFGYGYVWNPPPFLPVEGYTNFLWMLLLEGVWRVFHIEPPASVNYLSLAFSFFSLVLLSIIALRMKWRSELRPYRVLFVGLILAFLLANRTFLAWTSSGLETAMFTFFIVGWVFCVLESRRAVGWPAFLATLAAALLELTRPDGLLYAGCTAVFLAYLFLRDRRALTRAHYLAFVPLVLVPLHLIWRFKTYGMWLPNSYYAKEVSWWPASGIRYAASFILEYALWIWIALAIVVAIQKRERGAIRKDFSVALAVVLATLLLHFLYYTVVVGGDHFEYRVYNHYLVLIPFSFVWLLNRTAMRASRAVLVVLLFLALSLPLPWTHFRYSQYLTTREETAHMKVAVAPHWPLPARPYAALFDRLQFWLIDHSVCLRHQEHKVCEEYLVQLYPPREEGLLLPSEGYPVHVAAAVGVASWVLPRVNILDALGLNDFVIARMPVPTGKDRQMAHDREASKDYLFCFYPNVFIDNRHAIVRDRKVPLTIEQIEKCEHEWRKYVLSRAHR